MFRRKAVLIIHGFLGGTYDLEYLANYLELIRQYDVYTFTLPGHDNVMNNMTRKQWIDSVYEHTEMLINNDYKTIYVVGHSMGGVLATMVANKYKEVKKLVLLAPAFKHMGIDKKGNFSILEGIKNSTTEGKKYTKEEKWALFVKSSFKALNEFGKLVQENEQCCSLIDVPTLLIQGLDDGVVPRESSEYVYNSIKHNRKKIIFYDNMTHNIFKVKEKEEVAGNIKKFLNSVFYTY